MTDGTNQLIDRMESSTTSPLFVLYDESHGESWTISSSKAKEVNPNNTNNCSYADAANVLIENGFSVSRNTVSPITKAILEQCDIFVINHPVDSQVCKNVGGVPIFNLEEINIIENWVKNGGSLFVQYEYEVEKWGSNINDLCERFGMKFENNIIIDQSQYKDSRSSVRIPITNESHDILQGVDQIIYYAGCSIKNSGSAEGVLYSNSTSIPLNAPLISINKYGNGRVILIGETDLFDPIRIKEVGHQQLYINIFNWLSSHKSRISISQQFSLFEDHSIINRLIIQNLSDIPIGQLSISSNLALEISEYGNREKKLINVLSGEQRQIEFKLKPISNTGKHKVGDFRINYIDPLGDIPKSFNLKPIEVNCGSNEASKPTFNTRNSKNGNIALMRKCPLNMGKCTLVNEISIRYRRERVFLDIPYRSEYAFFEKAIRKTLQRFGFIPVAAKDRSSSSILLCNLCEDIQTCQFAIADVSYGTPNILYELGLLHALGKKCAILRNTKSKEITDIKGLLYLQYETIENLEFALSKWILENCK